MNLAFVWGGAAVFAGWMILSLLGAERDRKIRQYEASLPAEPSAQPDDGKSESVSPPAAAKRKAA